MRANLDNLSDLVKEEKKNSEKYFAKLRKKPPKRLDLLMQDLHTKEFQKTNCLECANCCKTTSPIFTPKDIIRISKHLGLKEQVFISKYLQRDEEDFMVLKTSPCTFLDLNDNTCTIYDHRPKACSEYPHTNRRKFYQLTQLTLKNTEVCPAVYNIVEALKKSLPL